MRGEERTFASLVQEGDWSRLFRRAEPQHKLPSHFQRTMSRLSRGVGAALVWECCQLQISATNLARSSNRTLTSASDVIRRTMQLLRCSPHPKKPEEEFQTPKSDNFGTAGGYKCQRHRCAPMLAATMRRVVTPSMFLPSYFCRRSSSASFRRRRAASAGETASNRQRQSH